MHTRTVLVLEPSGVLDEEGRWRREAIRRYVTAVAGEIPALGMRLQRPLLGLTPPAWVPSGPLDLDYHLRLVEETLPMRGDALDRLAGLEDGLLRTDHPLWRMRFTRLTDGSVALGLLMHHGSGDALWQGQVTTALTTARAEASPAPEPDRDESAASSADGASPSSLPAGSLLPAIPIRSGLDLLRHAARTPEAAVAWRASPAQRSPGKRARWALSRALRPWRAAAEGLRAPALPPQRMAVASVAFPAIRDTARAHGCRPTDLVVAATMRAASTGETPIAIRMPVSRRGDDAGRNLVSDIPVPGRATESLPQACEAAVTALARYQDGDAGSTSGTPGKGIAQETALDVGYATLTPWRGSARWFAGSKVLALHARPAARPTDRIAVFGSLYQREVSLAVLCAAPGDPAHALRSIVQDLTTLPGERPGEHSADA